MGALAIVSLAAFLLLGVFAAINWSAFVAPVTLSFVVTSVDAPLGLLMLVLVLAFGFLNLAAYGGWQTSMLLESRRMSRELQAQRDMADRAETSRVADLRARVDTVEASLRTTLQEGINGLSAALGEVEDKLDRALRSLERERK
jgi:uncharacterized integral membrane protein